MKNFVSIKDVEHPSVLIQLAREFKANPFSQSLQGKHKTIGLIFMNPSLRTRLSTQKAAMNLGMQVMVMNIDKEGWALEMEDGAIMNGTTVEHIKDAAAVMGQYCDIIGLRSFPGLVDKTADTSEYILNKFMQYAKAPVISLESATLHPLQSLADMITIQEQSKKENPKIVLTWAPHIKAIPHAVGNSFAEWAGSMSNNFHIVHPEGMDLDTKFIANAKVSNNQAEALADADFIYVKNWSSFENYGKPYLHAVDWMLTEKKLSNALSAKVMHCLPVRRNVELSDEILDSSRSLVLEQANNRVWAAQAVISSILNNLDK